MSDRGRFPARLASGIERAGWAVVRVHTEDLDWWADEIWELSSRWSPEGTVAFVTLLVDPMREPPVEKGHGVWAAGCSASLPTTRVEAERNGVLRSSSSAAELELFVGRLNSLRAAVPVDGAV
jgi:hypothetical protein